jgi:hypothetical protein
MDDDLGLVIQSPSKQGSSWIPSASGKTLIHDHAVVGSLWVFRASLAEAQSLDPIHCKIKFFQVGLEGSR